MHWDEIQTRWRDFRPLAQRRWAALTEEQIDSVNGRRARLVEHLVSSYALTPEAADLAIAAWCMTFVALDGGGPGDPAAGTPDSQRAPPPVPPRRRQNPRP